jgi:hypothetical protein
MSKYDEAIAFLKGVEPGSYFDECAALMEELLARSGEGKTKRFRFSPEDLERQRRMDQGAMYYAKVRGLR